MSSIPLICTLYNLTSREVFILRINYCHCRIIASLMFIPYIFNQLTIFTIPQNYKLSAKTIITSTMCGRSKTYENQHNKYDNCTLIDCATIPTIVPLTNYRAVPSQGFDLSEGRGSVMYQVVIIVVESGGGESMFSNQPRPLNNFGILLYNSSILI